MFLNNCMSNYPAITTKRGFTLVETLVYVGLFALISTGSILALLSLQNLFSQYQAKQALFTASTNIMERVLIEVREADGIVASSSVFNDAVGALSLETEAGPLQLALNGTDLEITEAGSTSLLHAENITVEEFWVWHYEADQSQLVRFQLLLTAESGGYSETMELSGAAVARGTYEEL